MSSRYSKVRIAMDLFREFPRFAPAGQNGDRREMRISFEEDLPIPIPGFSAAPRVIVTPVRLDLRDDSGGFNIMTPVCAARDVTVKDFRLVAYNQDPDFGGSSAFNWVAIEEAPDATNPVPNLARGVLPPHSFAPFRESFLGRRTFKDHDFAGAGLFNAVDDGRLTASVQLTATDRGIDGHSVAAVGIVDNNTDESFKGMTAHNIDVAAGSCAFNWATFSRANVFEPGSTAVPEPSIETGEVAERWFEPGGQPGDWQTWDVVFLGRFANPPVVLLTATQAADIPERLTAVVVGVVQAETTGGFRLAARSCGLRPGLTGFNWIAIGDPA
jgi:hypothetical protein